MDNSLPTGRLRRVLRHLAFGLTIAGFATAALLAATGGFKVRILGAELRGHQPLRALWVSVLGVIAFLALGGRVSLSPTDIFASFRRHLAEWERALLFWLPSPNTAAACLAGGVCLIGVVYGTKVAGGADAYGYVSQADLWLSGRMAISQPFVADVPWPDGGDTFAPLGYRAVTHDGVPSLVPSYSPGLPLLMAAAKSIGGQDAMFLVGPFLGALLVLVTYGIGCRLSSPGAGLIGACLVATSPAVLFMLMPPMTDLPVAAMWTLAFYLMIGTGAASALGAGLASAVAVMIRPNLVPLAAVAGLYYVIGVMRRETRGLAFRHGLLFTVGLLPGVMGAAAINNNLYGSPFISGYGRLGNLFAFRFIRPNLERYVRWFVETQSPIAFAGFVALALPTRRLWPGVRDRSTVVVAGLFALSVWMMYLPYLVFDAWWYLRFLLTSWPFIMVGVGAVAMMVWRSGGRAIRASVVAGVILLILFQARVVSTVTVFDQWEGERRYIRAAQMVRHLTPPNSVIFSMQHSGTIRYYGGRMTMRFDQLDPAWLDRAIAWLGERGVGAYLVVEPWELPDVERRFAGSRAVERLDGPPLAIYEHPGHLRLYDLSGPAASPAVPYRVTGVDEGLKAVAPVPAPTLIFRTRTN